MNVIAFIAAYLFIVNLLGFVCMGADKRRAIKKHWRIPEATLFIIALIGGSVGSIIGMRFFHHKTRHWYFVYGMPAILILQIAAFVLLMKLPIDFYII